MGSKKKASKRQNASKSDKPVELVVYSVETDLIMLLTLSKRKYTKDGIAYTMLVSNGDSGVVVKPVMLESIVNLLAQPEWRTLDIRSVV
jgi:hypothetical protein